MEVNRKNDIARNLKSARQKLLNIGTRNRLIHVNRANQRSNQLNVINEQSDDIFSILRTNNKRMSFKAMGKDKEDEDDEIELALDEEDLQHDPDRLTDNLIETPLGPETLARRLLRIAGAAKTAEEEQGINILYLAIGFLRWYESPSSNTKREAPLILLPTQLVRNDRTSTYDIRCRDDDIATNLSLSARLKHDFGIALPEIEEDENWTPSDYLSQVDEAISTHVRWSVESDAMQVGLFSFAKLLMHRDLDPTTWPEDAFTANPLLQGLLKDGFPEDVPLFTPEDKLDEKLDPAEIIQVIDADASQTKVIEEVRRGSSLVVQGPPGTGKSQTITNIIAAAAHDGKTVLFVAEKMAALSVVRNRLEKSGLRDICLELHSRSANKKALTQELGRTLEASSKSKPAEVDPSQLRAARDGLNRIAELLHTHIPGVGDTPFQALSTIIGFIGRRVPPPDIPQHGLAQLNHEQRSSVCDAILNYGNSLKRLGKIEEHPFRGTSAIDLQPTDIERLKQELNTATQNINSLLKRASGSAKSWHLSEPDTIDEIHVLCDRLKVLSDVPECTKDIIGHLSKAKDTSRLCETLEAGVQWVKEFKVAKDQFTTSAWQTDVASIRPSIVKGQNSFFSRVFGKYRQSCRMLESLVCGQFPKMPKDRLILLDRIAEVQALRKRLTQEEKWIKSILKTEWRGENTPFERMLTVAKWIDEVKQSGAFSTDKQLERTLETTKELKQTQAELKVEAETCLTKTAAPISRLELDLYEIGLQAPLNTTNLHMTFKIFKRMEKNIKAYSDWAGYQLAKDDIRAGIGAVIFEALTNGDLQIDRAIDEFSYACAEAQWNAVRDSRPEIYKITKLDRHKLVSDFRELELGHIETAKNMVLARHFKQMPKGAVGEMGIIRGQIGRKRAHKPIRWLMKNAGSMLQRIKPVMLMSPISVAQFIPPGSITFDLLVVDEASQVRPEDALGVIARAAQIVVVGDEKQLPPTSFFDRLIDNSDEDDEEEDEVMDAFPGATAADMESVLSLCEARGLRRRRLEWHYRSRDPSLIQVSNAEFYENALVLPPSPLQVDKNYGLKFIKVAGVYATRGSGIGRTGTNRIEAEAICRAVAKHARDWKDLSLGVVAFSKAQADMITEVLELDRRKDKELDQFLKEGKAEDVFVKNIENVQGDERDVIFISVGYGPTEANGRLTSMRFGPVNLEGGERRLNVLFSRARVRCAVFASFDPGDIDLNRVKQVGPGVLKRFLEFAKTGQIEAKTPTGLMAESAFEEDVAQTIKSLGYQADPQVGTAGFRIDIGVRHPDRPGQYFIAVECDGASYHSALWARERDRLRQDTLENLGWQFHRIWSTDWYQNREQEISRLKETLKNTSRSSSAGIAVTGSNSKSKIPAAVPGNPQQPEVINLEHLVMKAPTYIRADLQVDTTLQPHEVSAMALKRVVIQIVKIEGPIHREEIARRVASAFGFNRAGKRIIEVTENAIDSATRQGLWLKRTGNFISTSEQLENPPVRDRSAETGTSSKAEYLPPTEILAAAEQILNESGEMPVEDLVKAIARLLGYKRVAWEVSNTIQNVLNRR